MGCLCASSVFSCALQFVHTFAEEIQRETKGERDRKRQRQNNLDHVRGDRFVVRTLHNVYEASFHRRQVDK